jgi:aspartyl-tRNA(Asn)/glutamyl-tRNA(Gln) amidotransferase subunit A
MAELSKPDWRDHMSLPPAAIDWSLGPLEAKGLRIGLHLDAGSGLAVDPEVKAAVETAAKLFAQAGTAVELVAPFLSPEMLRLQDLFWRVRSWVDFSGLSHERQARVLPFIADWCRGGADVSGATVVRATSNYMAIRAAAVRATQPFDYVLSPVSPVPTYSAHWETPTNDVHWPLEHIAFTMPYNMSEQPAASINCGYTAEGKPIGLQIAGRRFDDLGVMRLARWFETARAPQKAWPEPPKSPATTTARANVAA